MENIENGIHKIQTPEQKAYLARESKYLQEKKTLARKMKFNAVAAAASYFLSAAAGMGAIYSANEDWMARINEKVSEKAHSIISETGSISPETLEQITKDATDYSIQDVTGANTLVCAGIYLATAIYGVSQLTSLFDKIDRVTGQGEERFPDH